MFEVGFTELLLIFALALLVLGPQKLPKLAQQVGRWVGRARAMARQFRDQLEEEAHNLETKVSIDPGIDTSLDARRPPPGPTAPPPATPATGAAGEPPAHAAAVVPPVPPMYQDVEEEFYPPDHHMHPGNQAASGAAPDPNTQGELDLTSPPDAPPPEGAARKDPPS
jgi:Tat protein translocase TatB subunit